MIRRGLFRAIGLAAGGAALAKASPTHRVGGLIGSNVGTEAGISMAEFGVRYGSHTQNSTASDAHKAYSLFIGPHRRRERLIDRQVRLLNGMPPHIESMRSVAPWYRAMMAAKWEEDRIDDQEGLFEKARRKFFGETTDT